MQMRLVVRVEGFASRTSGLGYLKYSRQPFSTSVGPSMGRLHTMGNSFAPDLETPTALN